MERAQLANVHHYLYPNPLYRFVNGNITDLSLQVKSRNSINGTEWRPTHITDYMVIAYSGSQRFTSKELVYVGNTSLLNEVDITDKVVLVDPRNSTLSSSDMYKRVLEAGAAASVLLGLNTLPISRSCTGRDPDGHFLAFPVAYPSLKLIPHLVTSRQFGFDLLDALSVSAAAAGGGSPPTAAAAASAKVEISLDFTNFGM
jgi:hypothetical protein